MERVIMGIDPGTTVMGCAVVAVEGEQIRILEMEGIRFNPRESHYLRLRRIHERVLALVDKYLPDEMALEAPFCGKNVQSMLKLGRAQGVAMVAALGRDIPVAEYEPMKVKHAITGHGDASKEQVREMLRRTLGIAPELLDDLPLDATDALGVAMCHYYETQRPARVQEAKDWKAFVRQNPGRVGG